MTVPDLAAARSTWNGTDTTSREILAPGRIPVTWPRLRRRVFLVRAQPSRDLAACRTARAGLYEKAFARLQRSRGPGPDGMDFREHSQTRRRMYNEQARTASAGDDRHEQDRRSPAPRAPGAPLRADVQHGGRSLEGDLGAFLRDRIVARDDLRPRARAGVGAAIASPR